MANDRQNRMWIMGVAMKHMEENNLDSPNAETLEKISDVFTKNGNVSKKFVCDIAFNLKSNLEKASMIKANLSESKLTEEV